MTAVLARTWGVRQTAAIAGAFAGYLLLAACSGVDNQERVVADPNIAPSGYKAEIQAFLRSYLNDPTGIRGAFVSEPEVMDLGGVRRYASCLRFNARKSGGQYEGSKDRVVVFLNGRLDTMVLARGEQCKSASFKPFPEIEKLTR
jgi:hypothetical protein